MSFDLLSEPIRKYIRDKRWEELRPIQNAAISKILTTDNNYILISKTASGKTEAVFLPILSKVNFKEQGVQVLYISPLIALINDQFNRVEELCKYLDVRVTKWHGESKKSLKDQLLKEPSGIVLITPESLESMFVNKPYNVKLLFGNLKYTVIDEIHSFVGSDRGIQLMSILYRLQEQNSKQFNIVGLSATISEENKFSEVKQFTGNEEKTKVLIDRTAKEIGIEFRYFENKNEELPPDLLDDLYNETKESKVLVFPNSRGKAEEVAVKLQRLSSRLKGHSNYFSHHSSIDKEVREYVEYFAKSNKRQNFCISCTSTLELGIDIGTVDKIVQIDAAHSIASLIQRTGRSGRRNDEKSNLYLYSTEQWSLLQSVASWLLYKQGFIEPPAISKKPYDILLHQALSITKGHSGLNVNELFRRLKSNNAFSNIDIDEVHEIINHLISTDFIEKLRDEVIVGISGEKIINSREFYSVFKTEENFKVVNAGTTIGEIPLSPQIREEENILLAARIWKIKYIDLDSKKIEVVKASDGKPPIFSGQGGDIHLRIREKMLSILISVDQYDFLDQPSENEINKMRNDFSVFDIKNIESDRPTLVENKNLQFFTFTSSRINRTLNLLFYLNKIECYFDDRKSLFEIECSKVELLNHWDSMLFELENIDHHLHTLILEKPMLMDFSKWGVYLPIKYQVALLKEKRFDIGGTKKFIESINFIESKE
jgi:ATP-dependent helicase Lhr and Lhr-like helicase